MPHIDRQLGRQVLHAARGFPSLIVTGPRRAGKTTMLRHLFPRATYVLLEDPAVVARVQSDPNGFLHELKLPVILDEVQNAPQLFDYVRALIDAAPRRKGQWLFTGSQEAGLMKGVTESMAGRAALLQLMPLSTAETSKVTMFRGGFPEVLLRPSFRSLWFRSYLQTYLERDVRAISSIRDLATFRRFLALLASRGGQILNKTDLAAPLGMSVHAITEWLNILEITGQLLVVPPFFENFGKRLIKSPKIYFVDSGLVCHLLGIDSEAALRQSPFLGAIWEGFVASEIIKQQVNAGKAKQLYFFRDQQGLEIDFIVPRGNGRLALVESKAGRTVMPRDGGSIARLAQATGRHAVEGFVVHQPAASASVTTALLPGVKAVGLAELLEALARR